MDKSWKPWNNNENRGIIGQNHRAPDEKHGKIDKNRGAINENHGKMMIPWKNQWQTMEKRWFHGEINEKPWENDEQINENQVKYTCRPWLYMCFFA